MAAAEAGLARIRELAAAKQAAPVVQVMCERYAERLQHLRNHLDGPVEESRRRADAQEREVQRQVLAAERQRVTVLRDQGVISDDILQRIERELDLEEARREQP